MNLQELLYLFKKEYSVLSIGEKDLLQEVTHIIIVRSLMELDHSHCHKALILINSDSIYEDMIADLLRHPSLRESSGLALFCTDDEKISNISKDGFKESPVPVLYFSNINNEMNFITDFVNILISYVKPFKRMVNNDFVHLIHLITHEKGLQEIISLSAEILKNPLIITDESFRLLGYSKQYEVDEPIWNEIVTNGFCPYPIVQLLKKEGFLDLLNQKASPVFLNQGAFSKHVRRLVSEVRIDGKIKGYIALLEYFKEIELQDQELLNNISAVFALELANKNAIEAAKGHMTQELLRHLIEGTVTNEASALNRVYSLGWNLFEKKQIFLLQHRNGERIQGQIYDETESLLAKGFLGAKMGFMQDYIVVMVSWSKEETYAFFLEQLKVLCKKNQLVACFGKPRLKLTDLAESYREARKMLSLSNVYKREETVFDYSDMIIYDILILADHKDHMHPGIIKLMDAEKTDCREYLLTLKTYFQSSFSLKKTSELLYLHRNTVSYRLKRIEDIAEISLEDYQTCLHLQLSLSMLELDAKNQ